MGTKTQGARKKKNLDVANWIDKLSGVPCFLMGNAPSLNDVNTKILNDYFTIGINRIFFKHDPTILFWQDLALWTLENKQVLNTKAIKVCREGACPAKGNFYTFKLKGREPRLTGETGTLYGRGSSAPVAYQFAYALGCDPIILVGMDCAHGKVNGKKRTDYYGDNPMHKPHTIPNCIKGLKFIRNNYAGRKIINCSRNTVFSPPVTVEEVIATLGEKRYTRKELEGILLR